MTYERALRIFGLNSGFTEEELKKTYRKLASKYHPDVNSQSLSEDECKRKMQEINEARECLRKNTGNGKNSNADDIREYKTKIQIELNNIIEFNLYDTSPSEKIRQIIMEINDIVLTSFYFVSFTDKDTIDVFFKIKVKQIRDKFKEIETVFYQENYIDKKNIKENINYNCTLKEFYNQLLKIREKYSKEALIRKRLEEEIEKYKNYAGYEELKLLIDVCKQNALNHLYKNNFQNIDQEIDKMHQQIMTEVFETHYTLKNKISQLETIVNEKIDDEQIQKECQNIKQSFQNGSSFYDIEKAISRLEKLIDKYLELLQKKTKFEENSATVNAIYQSLIDRYTKALKEYDIVTQYETISNLNRVLEAFKKCCENFVDLECLNLFNKITFKNVENDNKVLNEIIEPEKKKRLKIYIKEKCSNIYEENSFFVFDEEKMLIYRIYPDDPKIRSKKIDYEELEENYISLEEFLDKSEFEGNCRNLDVYTIELLYKKNETILFYRAHKFYIGRVTEHLPHCHYKNDTDFDKYKNKEYVYSLIEKQIIHMIEKYQKQNIDVPEYDYNINEKKYQKR